MRSRTSAARAVVLAALFVAGCSGGDGDGGGLGTPPTAPTPPPPSGVAVISGSWNGTSDFQKEGTRYISNTNATIAQNDRTVSGTIRFTSPGWEGWQAIFSGTLAGTAPDTQFVGTINLHAPSSTGTGVCRATFTMAGPSVGTLMRWETPVILMTNSVATQPINSCRGQLLTLVWIFFR